MANIDLVDPFKLLVTYRPNIYTEEGWQHITLQAYLRIIETDKDLKEITERLYDTFVSVQGWSYTGQYPQLDEAGNESYDDYIIEPRQLKPPFDKQYKSLKKKLPCVNFFGEFLPPVSAPSLRGEGNGIIVLDVDLKKAADKGQMFTADLQQIMDEQLHDFFVAHPSTIFYYTSSSGLGYHVGFLTDAKTPDQHEMVFDQLYKTMLEECPTLSGEGILDRHGALHSAVHFTNYSAVVTTKTPDQVFAGSYEKVASKKEREAKEEYRRNEEIRSSTAFPYSEDFRLFLAYKNRDAQEYFRGREDWVTLMHALRTEYPYAYLDRMVSWFERLSALSSNHDPAIDLSEFHKIVDSFDEQAPRRSGVDFIISHLNKGQETTQTPQYALEDIKQYFEDLADQDLQNAEVSDYLYIDRYLGSVKDRIAFEENLVVESPPGTGKSTLFLQYVDFKRVYLVPTKILLEDLRTLVPHAVIVQEGVFASEISAGNVILSTYEGLEKILASRIQPKDYTLIVDEAHNLFISSSHTYRFEPMHRIMQTHDAFKNTILLSGTWIPFPLSSEFKFLKVKLKQPRTTTLQLINSESPLDTLTTHVVQDLGKQIVMINNKTQNKGLEKEILGERKAATITLVNSDTKNKKEVKEILKNNHLKPGHILIGTQMLVEGISFIDPDISAIRFYRNMIPEYIAQLSFRARNRETKPAIVFYQKGTSFRLEKKSNYWYAYNSLKAAVANKELSIQAAEYIDDTLIRIPVERTPQKRGKPIDTYFPYILDTQTSTEWQLNELLLGNFALENIALALNADMFSLLAHLRKWNFIFEFAEAEKTANRERYKKMYLERQKEILAKEFSTVKDFTSDQIDLNMHTPLYHAWLMIHILEPEFFLKMSEAERVELFVNKKRYLKLAEEVLGYSIVKGKDLPFARDIVSKDFHTDEQVLMSIGEVEGFPFKISNKTLKEKYQSLTVNRIIKILEKQFVIQRLNPTKTPGGQSTRHIKLTPRDFDFIRFIQYLKPW